MSFRHEDRLSVIPGPSSWTPESPQVGLSRRRSSRSFLQRYLTQRRSSSPTSFNAHGALGLNLLNSPTDPLLDLIFVHGLGGGSTKTWCSSEDVTQFWPKEWLPREPGIHNMRIHSYGYDADWQSSRASSTINVHDFGHQLLERLRGCSSISRSPTPIVFVAHSMGGLVVKQAYVLARQDPAFADLAKRIEAMIFLATPHRGSDLAQTLNNVLRASGMMTSRSYISNLSGQNELLALLNDSFRHYAPDISLYSFYESRPTNIFLQSEVIVTKDSAVLGYPHERSAMLDADHKQICKFSSSSDPNYTTFCEALRSVTEHIITRVSAQNVHEASRAIQRIESFLAMPARPDDDLKDVEEARIEGSCEWFAEREKFHRWADPDSEAASAVYWISANPATGKSVLSGYVINTLADLGFDCSYYFFRHGDKDKSTVSGFLRSLLYQMALRSEEVRHQLQSQIEMSVRYNKDDSKVIWNKLILPILSRTTSPAVRYWVLDALDECTGFESLFAIMARFEKHTRIRILITSRMLPEIRQKFAELHRNLNLAIYTEEISVENTKADIRLYLAGNRLKFHVGGEDQINTFSNLILAKSEGCFLWVRIVLDELALAWSIGQVQRILDEVPREMDPLYSRALSIMSARPESNRDIIRAILTWVICCVRPLTVTELGEALRLDLDDTVPELDMAIASLCAQLIHVDKNGRVMIVHLTAKTFLTNEDLDSEFRVDSKQGQLRLAKSCLQFLCSDEMRPPRARGAIRKQTKPPRSAFARYACLEFAEHLRLTTSTSAAVSNSLYSFLEVNVLTWIEFVAAAGNLSILTRMANSINGYLQRHIETSSPLGEFVHVIRNWAIDLNRIVTGFGSNLLAYPAGIYWLIPPFCPKSSAIAITAGQRFSRITIRGLKDEGWNDRMSCIDTHDFSSTVACGDTIFAVGYNTGSINLHQNSTCLIWKTLDHGSTVCHLLFNSHSTHLVSAGRRDIKIWEVDNGFVLWNFHVSHDIMNLSMTEDDSVVMAADKGNNFISWNFQSGELTRTLNWAEMMPFADEGKFRRPPLAAAISPDSSLIAIVYRGRPICLFDLEDDTPHGLITRDGDPMLHGLGSDLSPMSLVFNTRKDNATLAVAYEDGDLCLFDYEELKLLNSVEVNAHSVACSPDGTTLLTGNSNGMVQVLEFNTLQLIYRVNAADYGIRSLSFSVDNLRFLDVRGTQCNVWEPAVLLGMTKRDDSSTEPAEWEPIIKGIDNEEVEITSIELDHSEKYFFVGRSDGSLSLFDTEFGKQQKVLYRHNYQISVNKTIWGSKKHVIVTSDTACRFIVCALRADSRLCWEVSSRLLDRRADSMVLGLLLNPSDDLLLVSTEKSNTVWNLGSGHLVYTQTWQPAPSFSWISHPEISAQRVLITTCAAEIFDWGSNSRLRSVDLRQSTESGAVRPPGRIKHAFTFAQSRLLFVESSSLHEERCASDMMMFNWVPNNIDSTLLKPVTGFGKLGKKIEHIIGGCGSRLLFMDASRWVCSVDTTQGNWNSYVQHFPIPSDWRSQQRTLLMSATRNGAILFVRANEVAVISKGLDFEERIAMKSD
ncbi:related to vegetatible incompatibility protein HET-E-1 [Rhynchosporium graminicola]|uniref:GPI inositol-deacylase n=1 Tax=Rhynchosporium graminicola TaxID=2792576 RepID=A0A1E1LBA2_9HELO|nr:related to vegetatible incompatibility protein HET-E-1 [Rhynchosporium commune]